MYHNTSQILIFLLLSITVCSFSTLDINQNYVKKRWSTLQNELNTITEFVMQDNDLSQQSLIKIFSHQLPLVEKFNLTANEPRILNPKLTKIIFESKYFSRLKSLDLSNTNLDDRAFAFLAERKTPLNSSLQQIRLNNLLLGSKGFQYLSTINFNGLLKKIQVKGTLLFEKDAIIGFFKMICSYDEKSICRSQLTHLHLQQTSLTRDNFISIIQTINTSSLIELGLQQIYLHKKQLLSQGFNYTAYQFLAKRSFPKLENLIMADMDINDDIAKILSKWETPKLKRVSLARNPLTNQGVKYLISKKRLPELVGLNLIQTGITDSIMQYFVSQNFQWRFLAIGKTKISPLGFSQFTKMKVQFLQHLMFLDLYLSEDDIVTTLNNMTLPNLKKIQFLTMNDQPKLLMKIKWKRLPALKELIIQDTNLEDSSQAFINNSVRIQKLQTLKIVSMQWTMYQYEEFMQSLPTACPSLRNITIIMNPPVSYPTDIMALSKMGFREGTHFQLGYVDLVVKKGTLYVKKLMVIQYLFYEGTSTVFITDQDSLQVFYKRISQRIDLSQIQEIYLMDRGQMQLFKILLSVVNMTQLPFLKHLQITFDSNSENFFDFYQPNMTPHLRTAYINLIIPGDLPPSYVDQTLIPFFSSFPNLIKINIKITFLNQQTGPSSMKKLLDSIYYPFLSSFFADDQQLQASSLTSFIQKHSSTIRQLSLDDNFLEQGLFQLLAQSNMILQGLSVSRVSFPVEEFAFLGKMSTQYLDGLILASNDLTDEHIIAMLNESQSVPGPYFPKLQQLSFEENNIQAQGLEALLSVGLTDLTILNINRNNIPQYLNLLLKYPNRVNIIQAYEMDIYSLDDKIYPESVQHVLSLVMKTFSFSQEDFKILSNLKFSNLEQSILWLRNIYSCEVLKDLLKINSEAHIIAHIIQNDDPTLNSSCLVDYPSYSTTLSALIIMDSYSSTYLPDYIKLVTNTSRSIKQLQLINTRLSAADLKIILSRNYDSIAGLSLPNNYLDDDAFKSFLDNDLDHLYLLDLSGNKITSASISALAAKNVGTLVLLNLGQNFLNETAIRALQVIGRNLQQLDLSGCNLIGTSLGALKDIQLPRLQYINLDYNQFTQDNLLNFAADLKRSNLPSLSEVSLNGVPLSKQNYEIIIRILTRKRIVCHLDKPYNIPIVNAAKY